MKIKFPVSNNELNFSDIDFDKGIIITKNPVGIIQVIKDLGGVSDYYFYTSSNIKNGNFINEDNMNTFCAELFEAYPDLTAEFITNEI